MQQLNFKFKRQKVELFSSFYPVCSSMELQLFKVILILFWVPHSTTQIVKIRPKEFSILFNIEYMKITKNESNANNRMDAIYFSVLKQIPNIYLDIFVELENPKFTIINYTMNLCYIEKYRRRNVFIRYWLDVVLNSTDFKPSCPVKKGFYTINEHSQDHAQSANFLPSKIRFNNTYRAELTARTKQKNIMIDLFIIKEVWDFGFD